MCGPVEVNYGGHCVVDHHGVFDFLDALAQVPDECPAVVACTAYVAAVVGGPGQTIYIVVVALQLLVGVDRGPHIDDRDPVRLQREQGQVVRIYLVPGHSQNRDIGCFVENRAVLQVPQVKSAQRALAAHTGEDVGVVAEGDVVYFFVVRDYLPRLHHFLEVPDRAGGVDACRPDNVAVVRVPVETGDRPAVVTVLVVLQKAHVFHIVVLSAPQLEVVAAGGQQGAAVWVPHDLGRGVLVLEGRNCYEFLGFGEVYDLNVVAPVLD